MFESIFTHQGAVQKGRINLKNIQAIVHRINLLKETIFIAWNNAVVYCHALNARFVS